MEKELKMLAQSLAMGEIAMQNTKAFAELHYNMATEILKKDHRVLVEQNKKMIEEVKEAAADLFEAVERFRKVTGLKSLDDFIK